MSIATQVATISEKVSAIEKSIDRMEKDVRDHGGKMIETQMIIASLRDSIEEINMFRIKWYWIIVGGIVTAVLSAGAALILDRLAR